MFDDILVKNLVQIKQNFAHNYQGNAHIQEVIPTASSERFPIDPQHILASLHNFAQKNPIYFERYQQKILGVDCTVYEGDINQYWLDSIKHSSSCQPFYPTWIMSAFVMARTAKQLGYTELVDIGSGDGRIAYCGHLLGMTAHSIEIDDTLSDLQRTIGDATGADFETICDDALLYDYAQLNLKRPIFFIGGLPQMGGDMLAAGIIGKIKNIGDLKDRTAVTFAGTHAKRELSQNLQDGGWSTLMAKHDLGVIGTVTLPTTWTFDQDVETPYIYTRFN